MQHEHDGPWVQLRSGRPVYLQHLSTADFGIEDMGWAIAHLCRYNGHSSSFYSVAEHSVLLALHLHDRGEAVGVVRAALLHDLHEGLIGDMSAPLKSIMSGFRELEDRCATLVAMRYGLRLTDLLRVRAYDHMIRIDERLRFMPEGCLDWGFEDGDRGLGVEFHAWAPRLAHENFMGAYRWLYPEGAE